MILLNFNNVLYDCNVQNLMFVNLVQVICVYKYVEINWIVILRGI